jgi:hypothetical protein
VVKVARGAYVSTEVPSSRCPDERELRKLSGQLDPRRSTFLFAHARLAWLESHGERKRA